VQKLYQWLWQRARYFGEEDGNLSSNRTVRTEVTVERSRATLLLGDLTTAGAQSCPVCGQSLATEQSKGLPPKTAIVERISPENQAPKTRAQGHGET
jgi:hypothetical protein